MQSKIEELKADLSALDHDKQTMTQDKIGLTGTIRGLEDEKAGLEKALANEQQLCAIVRATVLESYIFADTMLGCPILSKKRRKHTRSLKLRH